MRRFEQRISNQFSTRFLLRAALLLGVANAGCIEVGHDAEVGCLVDPDEPGCQLDGGASTALRSQRGAVMASSHDAARRRALASERHGDNDAFASDAGASAGSRTLTEETGDSW